MEDLVLERLPVAIIGAGPVGLAAAAHLAERQIPFIIFEQGASAGHSIAQWAHVRVFSPWQFNIDEAARRLLTQSGWVPPSDDDLPTGQEIIDSYLSPLASHPVIAASLKLGAKVISIGRLHTDKVKSAGREAKPFEIRLADGNRYFARAVIDASGTWFSPNPLGAGGYPARGEEQASDRITYGIPDILGVDRARFANKKVLVVGAGHSAINSLLDLVTLSESEGETRIRWALRRDNVSSTFGGGEADALPARGALGSRIQEAVAAGKLEVLSPFSILALESTDDGIKVFGQRGEEDQVLTQDQIIAATGFRPDHHFAREVRLRLDPWLEAVEALAPLIDPNEHSCGTVRPHGFRELSHPEPDYFIVGMKSYGRAPTFLMATGYEQVRSIAAALAGDMEAADRVELKLPETGVCRGPASSKVTANERAEICCAPALSPRAGDRITDNPVGDSMNGGTSVSEEREAGAAQGCCGGPAPEGVDACCVKDANAKAEGKSGCGCSDTPAPKQDAPAPCCG